ncbi:MAG: hypothetical protein MHPDNHAH_03226 [Anaerolineales bacterium]|nr:hypothetical protein [Anaerolineales bacterium]
MDDWLIQALFTLATGLLLSIVTAILTVRLSLHQFYSQRWWEKKQDQYEKILVALYHIRHIDDKLLASVGVGKDLKPERKEALLAKSHEGSEEIERMVSIGAFAISKEALDSLKRLRAGFDSIRNRINEMSYYEYLEKHITYTDDCISEIIAIGRRELKVD